MHLFSSISKLVGIILLVTNRLVGFLHIEREGRRFSRRKTRCICDTKWLWIRTHWKNQRIMRRRMEYGHIKCLILRRCCRKCVNGYQFERCYNRKKKKRVGPFKKEGAFFTLKNIESDTRRFLDSPIQNVRLDQYLNVLIKKVHTDEQPCRTLCDTSSWPGGKKRSIPNHRQMITSPGTRYVDLFCGLSGKVRIIAGALWVSKISCSNLMYMFFIRLSTKNKLLTSGLAMLPKALGLCVFGRCWRWACPHV